MRQRGRAGSWRCAGGEVVGHHSIPGGHRVEDVAGVKLSHGAADRAHDRRGIAFNARPLSLELGRQKDALDGKARELPPFCALQLEAPTPLAPMYPCTAAKF